MNVVPFPDVSGLRSTNRDRSDVVVAQRDLGLLPSRFLVEGKPDAKPQVTVTALFAILLHHYLAHENSGITFLRSSATSGQDGGHPDAKWMPLEVNLTAELADGGRHATVSDIQSLLKEKILHVCKEPEKSEQALARKHAACAALSIGGHADDLRHLVSGGKVALGLHISVAPAGNAQLRVQLLASSAVHSDTSANLMLAQFVTLADAFHGPGKEKSPALSTALFPNSQLAFDNANPRTLTERDAGKPIDDAEEEEMALETNVADDFETARLEDLFANSAIRFPQRLAIDFQPGLACISSRGKPMGEQVGIQLAQWTYAEVRQRSDILAAKLQSVGIGQGRESLAHPDEAVDIVVLCLPKSAWTYLSMLAVIKAGAAWCPIDVQWPAERRQALISKARAKCVVTVGSQLAEQVHGDVRASETSIPVVGLDSLDWSPEAAAAASRSLKGTDELRAHNGTPSSGLAYAIWTSGTTGLPKAVGIRHFSAVQAIRSLCRVIPHSHVDTVRYLQFSEYSFDLSIMDTFYTWALGGTICSSDRASHLTDLAVVANKLRVTHSLLTPAVMAMMKREDIPCISVLISGGEKLSQVVADEWSREDCCLLNLYGPAEATLIAMHRRVPVNDTFKSPNIGVALPTASCIILDARGELVPKGCVGELCLGGSQLAQSYLFEPEKTENKFVNHPRFGRIYHTGDLARQLADQSIEYLGRSDDQVKIHGIRIELLEINATLKAASRSVRDSETMALPSHGRDEDGGQQIVNFSVVEGDHLQASPETPTQELLRTDAHAANIARELRAFAIAKLPSYMVPSLFVILRRFPRNSSAKIDRVAIKHALSQLDIQQWEGAIAATDAKYFACDDDGDWEMSKEAAQIRSAVAELCHVDAAIIGGTTPLLSIGLDSMKAIALGRKLAKLDVHVSAVDIIQLGTLRKITEHIVAPMTKGANVDTDLERELEEFDQSYRPAVSAALHCSDSEIEAILPLSVAQVGMLVETLRDPSSYWIRRVFTLPLDVDVKQLKEAIRVAVAATEALRTCFLPVELFEDDGVAASSLAKRLQQYVFPPCSYFQTCTLNVSRPFHRPFLQAVKTHAPAQITLAQTISSDYLPLNLEPPVKFTISTSTSEARLTVQIHHTLYDAHSLDLLQSSINACYSMTVERSSSGPTTKAAVHQLLRVDEAWNEDAHSAWSQILQPFAGRLESPSFPDIREATLCEKTKEFKTVKIVLTKSTVDVQQAATALNATPRAVFLSVWAYLLKCYFGTSAFLVGETISLRGVSSTLADASCCLITTAPVPVQINETTVWRDIVDAIHRAHQCSMRYPQISSQAIRKLLDLPARQSLYAALFTYTPETGSVEVAGPLLSARNEGISVEHAIACEILSARNETHAIAEITYDPRIADESGAQEILTQLDHLISSIAERPSSALGPTIWQGLPLSSLSQSTTPSLSQPPRSAIGAVLQECQSRMHTAAVEVWHENDSHLEPNTFTYEALLDKVCRVASYLEAEAPAGARVAVDLPRTIHTYSIMLAIFATGRCYVPIDQYLPAGRKQVLLEESESHICVATAGGTKPVKTVSLDELYSLGSSWAPAQFPPKETLACIMFTSGSTGKPKKVGLSHGNLDAALMSFEHIIGKASSVTESSRFMARSAEAFDVHLLEALLPLSMGATVVTASRDLIMEDLPAVLRTLRVTHAAVVPSLFQHPDGRPVLPSDLPDLKALIIGGERIKDSTVHLWTKTNTPVLQAYGPTEATIGSSCKHVDAASKAGNVGAAFPGSTYKVVDIHTCRGLATLPRGHVGELVILGPQVAEYGYCGAKDNVFGICDGQKSYRTGDLARMHGNGEVEILGRKGASQVKINGVRIELDDVASTILHAPSMHAVHLVSIAVNTKTRAAGKAIAVFASRRANRTEVEPSFIVDNELESSIQKEARERLPAAMIPSYVLILDFLPLHIVSAKVDRTRLLQAFEQYDSFEKSQEGLKLPSDGSKGSSDDSILGPLKILCQKLLQLARSPGEDDDLFRCGLDSILAIRLASSMRRQGWTIDAQSVLANPTLRQLATLVMRSQIGDTSESSETALHDIEPAHIAGEIGADIGSIEAVLPTVPSQAAMLASSVIEDGGTYVTSMSCSLPLVADLVRLRDAWESVIMAHAIYRATFVPHAQDWVQVILKKVPEGVLPLAAWSPTTFEQQDLADLVKNMAVVPPLRVRFVLDSGMHPRVIVLIHHALYDGVSLPRLWSAVADAYAGRQLNPTIPHGVAARRIWMSTPKDSPSFWRKYLNGATASRFPCLTGRRLRGSVAAEYEESDLLASLPLSRLRQRAAEAGVTPHVFIASKLFHLLSAYLAQHDVTIGLVLSGRHLSIEGIEDAHGPFLNVVPWRLQSAPSTDAKELQSIFTEVFRHQAEGLTRILRHAGLTTSPFDMLFAFTEKEVHTDNAVQSILQPDPSATRMRHDFPLALEACAGPLEDHVNLHLRYSTKVLPTKHADLLLRQLDWLLSEQKFPKAAPSLLSVENPTPVWPQEQHHFLTRFSNVVRQSPDADALRWRHTTGDIEVVTFGQLDRASDNLATKIVHSSAPNIAVHLDRGIEWYTVMLAIWKSGKGYVPLDTSLPEQRVLYMLEAVADAAIISHQVLPIFARYERISLSQATTYDQRKIAVPSPALSHTAYIMFTSGSTGKPKGVRLSHMALAAAILSWKEMLPHSESSRMLQLASPGFDVSLIEICMPLALGFAVTSGPKDWLLNDLSGAMQELGVTLADLPAALVPSIPLGLSSQLEWLMSGGDAIDERVLASWGPTGKLVNAWGPTETCIGNTLGFVQENTSRTLVGTAYPGSTVLILDESKKSTAIRGASGEIAVAGPQLADGYIGRPDLTSKAFVQLADGTPIYLTGDVGRMLADGRLQCLGRVDKSMVKINSQRVELDEISAALRSSAEVTDATTLYVKHPSVKRNQLVSFLTISSQNAASESGPLALLKSQEAATVMASALSHIEKHLPHYMIPVHIFVLANKRLPLTMNNKIDGKSLQQFFDNLELTSRRFADGAQRAETRPRTMLELQIASTVATFCDRPAADMNVQASFQSLGVDSISSIALAKQLAEALKQPVRARDVIQQRTISALADFLQGPKSTSQGDEDAVVNVDPSFAADAMRLSQQDLVAKARLCIPMQIGMLSQALVSEGKKYVHVFHFRAPSGDAVAVQTAFTVLIGAHDIFRLTFHPNRGQHPWLQVLHSDSQIIAEKCVRVDHCLWDAQALSQIAKDIASLEHFPRFRVNIVPSEDGSLVQLVMHHALYDGDTMALLMRSANDALSGRAVVHTSWFDASKDLLPRAKDIDFWTRRLSSITSSRLQTRYLHRPGHLTTSVQLPLPLSEARQLAKASGETLATSSFLAVAVALAEWQACSQIVIGRIPGLMINTVPSAFSLGQLANKSAVEAIQYTGDQLRDESEHDLVSLRDISKALRLTEALFDVLFDFQDVHEPAGVEMTLLDEGNNDHGDEGDSELHPRLHSSASSTTALTTPQLSPALDEISPEQLEKIVGIVAATAEVEESDIDPRATRLVSLGLDSVSAIRIVQKAREQGIQLSLRDVIDGKTCFGIAALIQGSKGRVRDSRGSSQSGEIPALPGQLMHLAAASAPASNGGVYSFAYNLGTLLETSHVRQAWQTLLETHTILSARFSSDVEGKVIVTMDNEREDLKTCRDEGDLAALLHDLVASSLQRSSPRLVHVLPSKRTGTSVLLLQLPHALYDAQSLQLMLTDLFALVTGGKTVDERPSFAEFARFATTFCRSKDARAFWETSLSGMRPTLLAPAFQGGSGRTTLFWRKDLLTNVKSARGRLLAEGSHSNLQSCVMAAWAKVLGEATGQESPIIGFMHSGRSAHFPLLDQLAAPCANPLPIMARNAIKDSLGDLASAITFELDMRRDFEQSSLVDIARWSS
ncbi:acetyl-CoA synthetase-like protein [Tilletiaria anomala UBC 951]|uniref:Acetyl-CoA synthetase-like protein n=1 Tax=Tilletiaria anomala (strain ATCC 24038 / CBS 436.72 / UBC 951) TaxID=1037660 RepID=A0A066VP93_TILAU|nr:acetyl-CoA synthetase-like protein [Tilletiaria anomala UBC 951]KDN40599.1 acetyl-CoA synthetase-like protein [Tilletiaria anomala UBC 951]